MKPKKIKELSTKSRLLLEKGPAVLCDIDCLALKSSWGIKNTIIFINLY